MNKMNSSYSGKQRTWLQEKGFKYGMQLLLLLILIILPFVMPNRFYMRLATEILIYGLLAMSLDVLLGYTGLLSFMHAAYMGIGAYTVGIFLKYANLSPSL